MYNHKIIEKKWQDFWEKNKTFKSKNPGEISNFENNNLAPKYYVLDMFPYPSGAGLHVGHPEGYTANDIIARYMHAKGFNVLHPMGWDAFGLPAENYAIKTGTHPRITTEQNIQVFKKQIKSLGFSYDWDREIDTTDPDYYKWTQWIFSKMFEEGLAYEQDLPINFCPSCKTGLANEEVLSNGTCERCGAVVEKKKIRQWVLAITKYADRLAKDVEFLDWPEGIKDMQRQWIGRSEGCQFDMRKIVEGRPLVIMLHGWGEESSVNNNWQPWLKEKLENLGYEVISPILPNPNSPDLNQQLSFIDSYKDRIDEKTIIIGHSMGGFLAMHLVEKLNKKISKLICVAPIFNGLINHIDWSNDYGWEKASISMKQGYNIEKVKQNTQDFIVLLSENDQYIKYKIAKDYFEENSIDYLDFSNAGHFCAKDGFKTFDKLLDLVNSKISVYTTRIDTVFGMTYAVIAPDHKDINNFITKECYNNCKNYIEESGKKSDLDRTGTNKDKTGVFTGSYVINPFNNVKVPLWIADYVLGNYGTGAVMAVPAHDERDFEFAKKYGLEIKQSIKENVTCEAWTEDKCETSDGILINSGEFSNLTSKEARESMISYSEKNGFGFKKINYKLRDWLFSRQRYWGEPIPLIHLEEKELDKLINLNFRNNETITSILSGNKLIETRALNPEEPENYFGNINEGDSVIFSDLINNSKYLVKINKVFNWSNIEELFNDKENLSKVVSNNSKYESFKDLENSYEILSPGYVSKIEKNGLIGFSFEIISKIYNGLYSKIILDKNLPIKLPEVDKYEPSPDGQSPLARVPEFVNVKLGKNLSGKRETNTMPQWGGSCWYYLRFMDSKNEDALVGKQAESYWGSVDSYVGGAEHAVLHLLYARFWHKFLYDIGVVTTTEPFAKLRNQGLILAYAYRNKNGGLVANDLVEEKGEKYYNKENGEELEKIVAKMSKSLKNVVNPDEIVNEYGADTLRLYEMYISDFKDSAPWDTKNIIGVKRFLDKVWNMFKNGKEGENDQESMKLLHKTIKKISEDIENYKFNTAIASLMILTNYGHPKDEKKKKEWLTAFLNLLHPFAPHMTEELWEKMGNKESVFFSNWPKYDNILIIDDEIEIAVQVLGKLRSTIKINKDLDKDSAINKAKENEEIKKWIDGKEILKEIYVPGKIINFVIK